MSDLSVNPFSSLFSSVGEAEQFILSTAKLNTSQLDQIQDNKVIGQNAGEQTLEVEEEQHNDPAKVLALSRILEQIFLFTLDSDVTDEDERPDRLVMMSELLEALDGQSWLDMECLEQAVFERLLLENPGRHVVSTRSSGQNPTAASQAGESQVLRYLCHCYNRSAALLSQKKGKQFSKEIQKCQEVMVMNARTSLQQPELHPTQTLYQQFISIYQEDMSYIPGEDQGASVEFFDKVVKDILLHEEDGTLSQVFTPVLNYVAEKFLKEYTLMSTGITQSIDMLGFFTKHEDLAKMFMMQTSPTDWNKGKAYEQTLLGAMLSFSCIPRNEMGPPEYFDNPSSKTKQELEIQENNVQQPLASIGGRVYQFIYALIKTSPSVKHMVLKWLGKCIHANSARSKIWSSQMPQLFNQMYSSDGFCLNLCFVMLKFCQPFAGENSADKLLRIQPSYTSVIVSNDSHAQRLGVHAQDLHKETCLIPGQENAKVSQEDSYNFITECFFLTHQCINMGFKTVHEKFLKLNQELGRIQRIYQEVRGQGLTDDVEPLRTIKEQMNKGMTLYLSIKAALCEPQLLEMCLNFHLASAIWLSKIAVSDDMKTVKKIVFPLPEQAPLCLAHVPEFLMGNVTDFTMFLQRFKSEMYQVACERLEHFMTLILVYMGSPDRMKNPHLRAELAETLAALLPVDPDQQNTGSIGILASFHKQNLFHSHPLIRHLSEKLLHVFVSIEMTGQSVAFEQKFNYRRPMYMVLEHIWEIEAHKTDIKKLAEYAEINIENTDPPLFLRFINLLINDAIFLLDEALSFMSQIKDKQQEKDSNAWQQLSQQQRQEEENNLRQISMLARYHNMMGNHTIHALEMITKEIKSIFCHPTLVERVAGMLNYFLVHLVGPKQKNFKVKDKNEYEFKPEQTVSDICQIYLNLGDDENFSLAVSGDGRSYSEDLFPKAIDVLQRIGRPPAIISDFTSLSEKIKDMHKQQQEDEEMFGDAPDEFLDPIMGTLMKDPVTLPTSNMVIDKPTIARHILSDQTDPFNRAPLSLDMVVPNTELKDKIQQWIVDNRQKKRQQREAIS